MTPENSRIVPELFLCDDCAKFYGWSAPVNPAGDVIEVVTPRVRQQVIKEIITRIMFRCGPGDSWKKNEKPDVSDIIVELSNLLDGPFTTEDAMEMAKRIGVSL